MEKQRPEKRLFVPANDSGVVAEPSPEELFFVEHLSDKEILGALANQHLYQNVRSGYFKALAIQAQKRGLKN